MLPQAWKRLGIVKRVKVCKLLPYSTIMLVLLPPSAWPQTVQKLCMEQGLCTAADLTSTFSLSTTLPPFVGFGSNDVLDAVIQAGILLTPVSREAEGATASTAQPESAASSPASASFPAACNVQPAHAMPMKVSPSDAWALYDVEQWKEYTSVKRGMHGSTAQDFVSDQVQRCLTHLRLWTQNSPGIDEVSRQISSSINIQLLEESQAASRQPAARDIAASSSSHKENCSLLPNVQAFFTPPTTGDEEDDEYCIFIAVSRGQILQSVRCICTIAPSTKQLYSVIVKLQNQCCSAAELFIDEHPQLFRWLSHERWGYLAVGIAVAGLILEAHRSGGVLTSVLSRLEQTVHKSPAFLNTMHRDVIIGTFGQTTMTLQAAELASWMRKGQPTQPAAAAQMKASQGVSVHASHDLAKAAVGSAARKQARRQWEEWSMAGLTPASSSAAAFSAGVSPTVSAASTLSTTPASAEDSGRGSPHTPTKEAGAQVEAEVLTWSAVAPRQLYDAPQASSVLPAMDQPVGQQKRYAPLSLDALLLNPSKQPRR